MTLIAIVAGWLLCAFVGAGIIYAEESCRSTVAWDRRALGAAIFFGLLGGPGGPVIAVMAFCFTGFCQHGFWNWRRYKQ